MTYLSLSNCLPDLLGLDFTETFPLEQRLPRGAMDRLVNQYTFAISSEHN